MSILLTSEYFWKTQYIQMRWPRQIAIEASLRSLVFFTLHETVGRSHLALLCFLSYVKVWEGMQPRVKIDFL